MTVAVWVVLLSIQWRNPLVLNDGDVLLRLLLFWGMFLPLGACWSVDRALKAVPPRLSMRFLSLATVGLFMQVAFMYWFTAIQKSGPEWRSDGTAIYYALSLDQTVTPIGTYLLNFPELLEMLTLNTILLEAFGPFLLFFPLFTGPVRTGAVLAFMSLHFGIWLTMDIGIFPWISAFCMVCFLPGWFWDRAAKLRTAFPKQLNIAHRLLPLQTRLSTIVGIKQPFTSGMVAYYNGDNNSGRHVAPMSTPSGVQAPAALLQGKGRPAVRVTGKTWSAAGVTVEREEQNGSVAGTRLTTLRSSLVTNLLAVFFLLYIFCWNLTTVSSFTMPAPLVPLGSLIGFEQSWGMFAPYPTKEDGWYVIPGNLSDGQQVDLMPVTRDDFSPREVSWEKPENVASTFKNEHWRKYLESIRQEKYAYQHLHFGRYICREWNARHAGDEQLETFQITYMLEETLPDYQPSTPEERVHWEHSCF
jgi:Vitamin K-dependent gamma-carboxylase